VRDHFITVENTAKPEILAAERDFLVVYKPPKMHSVPLARSHETILEWCVKQFPEIAELPGRREGEGGLLHRLDYETHGLMLFARTMRGMEALLSQQRDGMFLKKYSALSAESKISLPGFPARKSKRPFAYIESAFRPFGPGRKAVRPLLSAAPLYRTDIREERKLSDGITAFYLELCRGYRHQVRCHLAWLHWPIRNDVLYGASSCGQGYLGLRACSISFDDPSSGKKRVFSIPFLTPDFL